jgi:hypothetical protein
MFEDLARVVEGPVMEHESHQEYGRVAHRLWSEEVVRCTSARNILFVSDRYVRA